MMPEDARQARERLTELGFGQEELEILRGQGFVAPEFRVSWFSVRQIDRLVRMDERLEHGGNIRLTSVPKRKTEILIPNTFSFVLHSFDSSAAVALQLHRGDKQGVRRYGGECNCRVRADRPMKCVEFRASKATLSKRVSDEW